MLFYSMTEFYSSEVCLKVTTSKQLNFCILYMIILSKSFFAEIKETKCSHVILQVELLFTCSDKFSWTVM